LYTARSGALYPGFNGDIEQWFFEAGSGAFQIDPSTECEIGSCIIDPCDASIEGMCDECVILYSECNYGGSEIEVCDNMPFTNIDWEVKSIAVPEGNSVYLYNNPCFNGESAEISESIECLSTIQGEEDIDFQQLLNMGITIMDEKEMMKKNPGGKQARYTEPTIAKKETLKKFKKAMF